MFVLKAMFWAQAHAHAERPENQSLKTLANQMFAVHKRRNEYLQEKQESTGNKKRAFSRILKSF